MRSTILTILVATSLGAGAASAGERRGLVLRAAELPKGARVTLEARLVTARAAHPAAFAAVADILARSPAIHAQRRGRHAPFSAIFRRLGAPALMALVEQIGFDGALPPGLAPEAATALRAGLIEAAGALRAPEVAPLFVAVLEGAETDPLVVRMAAEALGKLGTDAATAALVAAARREGTKREAVLAGLGECRRLLAARLLAEELELVPDDTRAALLMESLRDVANRWAWETPAVRAHADEEAEIRAVAAQALWRAFLAYPDEARETARKALVVVDHPDTLVWVGAAKSGASAELHKALGALERSFGLLRR